MGRTSLPQPEEVTRRFPDPVSASTVSAIKGIAERNTAVYEEVFGCMPSDTVTSWDEWSAKFSSSKPNKGGQTDNAKNPTNDHAGSLQQIQGHLVEFPTEFLREEPSIGLSYFDGENFLPEDCFT